MLTEPGPVRVPGSHVVQFYDSRDALTASVATFLAEAIRVGGAAVMLAVTGQRSGFAEALTARGIDVAVARRGGALFEPDAAATLGRLTGRHGVDSDAFETVIGSLVRAAAAQGGPVRIYGDMVGLLWQRRDLARVLELERLWNAFGAGERFALLCGCPHPAPRQDAAAWLVVDLHSAVHAGPLPAVVSQHAPDVAGFYDPDPRSPGQARRMVREVLDDWHLEELVEDALLVVSELTTNAILHADSGFAVTLTRTPTGVRITVTDSSRQPPAERHPGPSEGGGRGVQLVGGFATRWGVAPGPAGKAVWADLTRLNGPRGDLP